MTAATPVLHSALSAPIWDAPFWDALTEGEEAAKIALGELYEESFESEGCCCDVCVVRTVLEAVWPVLTDQVNRIIAINQPVQTMGAGCRTGEGCNRRNKE